MLLGGTAELWVVLWAAGSVPVPVLPTTSPAAASPAPVGEDERVTELVTLFQQTKLGPALKLAHTILDEHPSDEDAGTARLVEAFALLRQKRSAEAEQALDELTAHGPDLGTYLTFLRASVAAARRECDEAEAMIRSLPADSSFINPGWSRLVTCWLNRHDLDQADAAAGKMTDSADSLVRRAEAMLMSARLAEIQRLILDLVPQLAAMLSAK